MSLRDLIEYTLETPTSYAPHKPYYIVKADGIYRHTKRDAILVKELFSKLDTKLPLLKEGQEGLEYTLPKIPMDVYLTILNFYKSVHAQDRTEASCHIFYLNEGETLDIPAEFEKYRVGILQLGNWVLYCPQQTNSGTLTSFREDKLYPYLRKHYTIAMETHSHHTMGAFWSGTDNANQQDAILYGVFGQINTQDDFLVKFVLKGENINIAPESIVDYPRVHAVVEGAYSTMIPAKDLGVYKGVFIHQEDGFPQEWLTECHKVDRWESKNSAYKYPSYVGTSQQAFDHLEDGDEGDEVEDSEVLEQHSVQEREESEKSLKDYDSAVIYGGKSHTLHASGGHPEKKSLPTPRRELARNVNERTSEVDNVKSRANRFFHRN